MTCPLTLQMLQSNISWLSGERDGPHAYEPEVSTGLLSLPPLSVSTLRRPNSPGQYRPPCAMVTSSFEQQSKVWSFEADLFRIGCDQCRLPPWFCSECEVHGGKAQLSEGNRLIDESALVFITAGASRLPSWQDPVYLKPLL